MSIETLKYLQNTKNKTLNMCEYFILAKPNNLQTDVDTENNIISLATGKIYILPKINLHYYTNNGLFEKHLIEWCKQFCYTSKNMLDLGAHCGTYSISLSGFCNHIYAFEPQKMTYYSLCGGVSLSNIRNITCINTGLGSPEQVGIQQLNIISDDGGGSTLHVQHIPSDSKIITTEEIKIKTLDSYNIENISFIKMDVENNELQILMGAMETLRKSDYPKILFEMNSPHKALIDFLENMKYKIIKLHNCDNMYLATI